MEKVSKSLAETAILAKKILTELAKKNGQNEGATVVTLEGDLGSGKTTFTQTVARTLDITEKVTSPTFVIMKKYLIIEGAWKNLIHIDCYRLDGEADLLKLGWAELVTDPKNLILVEWPERVGNLLSSPTLKIKFEVVDENSRKIIYGFGDV